MSSPEFSTNKGKAIPLRVRVQQLLAETFFSDLNRRYSSQLGPAERAFVMDATRLARSTSVPLLLRLRWAKDRWTLKHLWYRTRLPIRRKRWIRTRNQLAQTYAKSANAQFSAGRAVVFGDFSGNNGLSRGAIYDLAQLRPCHTEVIPVDIADYISGKRTPLHLITERVDAVYLFCQPDMYEHVFTTVDAGGPEAFLPNWQVGLGNTAFSNELEFCSKSCTRSLDTVRILRGYVPPARIDACPRGSSRGHDAASRHCRYAKAIWNIG